MGIRRALVLAGALAMALAWASSAHAIELTYVSENESVSAGTQSLGDDSQANCPAGTRAAGGGIVSSGAYNSSYVNSLYPAEGFDGNDREDDAFRVYLDALQNVTLTGRAVCVGGPAADKLRYKQERTKVAAGKAKTLRASCPGSSKVTGGGLQNSASFGDAELKTTRPVNRGRAWEGTMRNLGTTRQKMWVTAICASGKLAKGLSYRHTEETAGAGTQTSASTDCPGNDLATSGGVKVTKAASNVNSVYPDDGGGASQSYVDAGPGGPVSFTNYAVCADAVLAP
jgi:hypothetical protein